MAILLIRSLARQVQELAAGKNVISAWPSRVLAILGGNEDLTGDDHDYLVLVVTLIETSGSAFPEITDVVWSWLVARTFLHTVGVPARIQSGLMGVGLRSAEAATSNQRLGLHFSVSVSAC
jgi:hypothetical protein